MRGGGALVMATAVTVAGGASCSLGISLADLSGGASDAGSDGPTPAPPPPDAGASPEAGASFCATLAPTPSFCADFDEGGPPDRGWLAVTLGEGGALAVEGAVLRASAPRITSPTTATAFLDQPLATPDRRLHVEAKLRPTTLTATLTPMALVQTTGSAYRALILYVGPGNAHLQEETTVTGPLQTSIHDLPSGPAVGDWHTYAFDLDFSASGNQVSVEVDGKTAVGPLPLQYPWAKTGIDVQIGLVHLLTTDAAEYEIDDVVATVD